MLENCRNARERWGGVNDLIDRWLKERQELLVQYCELSEAARGAQTVVMREQLERLCDILVDYVSAGHFEVYEQLMNEAREFNDGGVELAVRLYPKIQETTEVVLNFNERFEADRTQEELTADLSELGEALETRFELEDYLIERLHTVHGSKVLSSV